MESDLSATGDFKVSNYGFNSVNIHQHTVSTLFYSGFFLLHVTLVSCLCVSLFQIYLQQGVGMNIFGLALSSYIFDFFFFLPVIEKLQHLFTFQHLGVSAVAHHYSILHSKKNRNGRFSFKCYSKSYFASQWTMGALGSLVSQQLFWVSG